MLRQGYILTLAILAILSSNMYLPALPIIQAELHTSAHLMQLTLSYYMLGLGVGMFFYGPVSDHFGRKPVLAAGLLLYTVGVIASALSHSIDMLLISRVLQAIGAAAALSLWQAIAVDTYQGHAPKVIATGYMVIGFIPAVSPFIGSYFVMNAGWQSVFVFLAVYGATLLTLALALPETRQHKATSDKHWLHQTLVNYVALVKAKKFLMLVLLSAVLYSSLYVFMAQTPHLLHELGYGAKQIGLFYIPISVFFIFGSTFARSFAVNQSKKPMLLLFAMVIYIIAALMQITFEYLGLNQVWWALVLPFSVMTFGTGVMIPLAVATAMSLHTHMSGASAAVVGMLQNLLAFVLSAAGAMLSIYGDMGLTISLTVIMIFVVGLSAHILFNKFL